MSDFDPLTDNKPADEVTSLQQARRNFLEHKRSTVKESSARTYEYPTKSFIQHCAEHGVSVTGDISKRHVTTWLDSRKKTVKPITVKNNAKSVRVFLKWMATRELCDWGIHKKFEMPTVPDRGDVNETTFREDHAESTFDFLETYDYATRTHAVMYTMWHTGCRISGAIALDVGDVVFGGEVNVLKFQNRSRVGTPLKNNNGGERNVTISDDLADVLKDYIEGKRPNVTDQYSRDPLFCTESQRIERQRAYKDFTAVTRLCHVSDHCPHDRDVDGCDAAQNKKKASGCPSSKSLHPIRRGSITYHIQREWPKEKLSERVDVSVEVLNKHYDARSKEQEREGRKQFLDLM